MRFELTNFVVGAVSGALIVLAIAFPRVGRIVARTAAVVLLAAGVGLLAWAIDALIRGDQLRMMVWGPYTLSEVSEAIGAGAGLLVAGGLALGLSFAGRSR
jgi:hypothetical protein